MHLADRTVPRRWAGTGEAVPPAAAVKETEAAVKAMEAVVTVREAGHYPPPPYRS